MPRWRHVVIVIEENHSYADIAGSPAAPYLGHLAASGVSFTHSYAITHPSQPNYVALFSGSTQGITDDSCPHTLSGNNLAHQLLAAHHSFAGYAENLPRAGDPVCTSGSYARKHCPWVNFSNVPPRVAQPLSAMPTNHSALPDVSFVIPDLDNDMHDGTVRKADSWLKTHLGTYASWAVTHDSLLVVTFDEDDFSAGNHIVTIAVGAGLRPGTNAQKITHYSLLRTLEDGFHLTPLGGAARTTGISRLGG
jgi:acid phosphatase